MQNVIIADDTGGVIDVMPLSTEPSVSIMIPENASEVMIVWK